MRNINNMAPKPQTKTRALLYRILIPWYAGMYQFTSFLQPVLISQSPSHTG